MERQEKVIERGLRTWLLILLVGNLIFVGVGLYSGIYHAVQMGISDHPLLQIATGITCILNVSLIYLVFRQKKWSAYALVAGLGIASVLFALSVFAAVEPTDSPEDKAMTVPFTVIIFLIGLVITIVSARVLRPVIRQPSR